jgi:hypothetical protein
MKSKGNFDQDEPKYAKEIQHIQDPVLPKRWDVQPCYQSHFSTFHYPIIPA